MIVKGRSRSDGGQLAEYLLNFEKNENVMVLETAVYHDNEALAIHESLTGFDYVTGLTKGTKGLYHAQVSPEAHEANRALESADWIRAADILGEKLGLEAQPRVLVLHEKDGKMHAHVVWQRTDTERGMLISDSNNYAKHEYASRQMEEEFGHRLVRGQFTGRDRDLESGQFLEPRPGYDSQTQTYQPKNHDHAATQQAERTKRSPETRKAEIAALWRQSDSGQAFVAAIHQAGYELVQGDAKPIHMLAKDGELYDLRRSMRGIKKDEILTRLAEYPARHLPRAAEMVERQLAQIKAREQGQEQESQAALTPAFHTDRAEQRRPEVQAPALTPHFAEAANDTSTPEMKQAVIWDRDAYHAEWSERIEDAAIAHALAEAQWERSRVAEIEVERERYEAKIQEAKRQWQEMMEPRLQREALQAAFTASARTSTAWQQAQVVEVEAERHGYEVKTREAKRQWQDIVAPRQRQEALQAAFVQSAQIERTERQAHLDELKTEREGYEARIREEKRQHQLAEKAAALEEKRNAMTLQHLDEIRKLERQHSQESARKEAELEKAYGCHNKVLEASIEGARQRLERGGFWYKLTRGDRRDREAIRTQSPSLAAGKEKEQQEWSTFRAKQNQQLEKWRRAHGIEARLMDDWIGRTMQDIERRLTPERERDTARDHAPAHNQTRGHGGGDGGRSRVLAPVPYF